MSGSYRGQSQSSSVGTRQVLALCCFVLFSALPARFVPACVVSSCKHLGVLAAQSASKCQLSCHVAGGDR